MENRIISLIICFVVAGINACSSKNSTTKNNTTAKPSITPGTTVPYPTELATTNPTGCTPMTNGVAAQVSYGRDVCPIIANNCISCHRAGASSTAGTPGLQRSDLTTYSNVKASIDAVIMRIGNNSMPPGPTKLTPAQQVVFTQWKQLNFPQ